MKTPKILFISRAYPPIVGGIENQNYELGRHLSKLTSTTILANKKGRKFLPLFAPYALAKTLLTIRHYDVILLGDGVLAILAWFIKLFSSKPIICVIHGLDINWNSASLKVWYEKLLISIYQNLWVKIFLPKVDHFVAVGNETVRVATEKGIAEEKITFIPNGVDTEKNLTTASRDDLEKILGQSLKGKKILLTSGRLAKRKGVAWFVRNVMPKLSEDFLYVVSGNGPDKENILQAIEENKLRQRVFMLGYVTDEVRNILLNTADLFVQPNIKIVGDMEGFGISVIEAGACGLPVLASRLEGLQDAIKDERNGFLVEHENTQAYVEKINHLFEDPAALHLFGEKACQFVIENYAWKKISQKYLTEIEKVIK